MDEGQCFRCGRVPRLCVCPEGVLERPRPPITLRPYQRLALHALSQGGLELSETTLDKLGITADEAHTVKSEMLRRYPKLRWALGTVIKDDPRFETQRRRAVEVGTKIHDALETLHRYGFEFSPAETEPDAHKVHFALRLAKLQDNYLSNVDADVTMVLESVGITDIYNPPRKWEEVHWRGETYVRCQLEDEDGIVTAYGLYLDWPAPTPDMMDEP